MILGPPPRSMFGIENDKDLFFYKLQKAKETMILVFANIESLKKRFLWQTLKK